MEVMDLSDDKLHAKHGLASEGATARVPSRGATDWLPLGINACA